MKDTSVTVTRDIYGNIEAYITTWLGRRDVPINTSGSYVSLSTNFNYHYYRFNPNLAIL